MKGGEENEDNESEIYERKQERKTKRMRNNSLMNLCRYECKHIRHSYSYKPKYICTTAVSGEPLTSGTSKGTMASGIMV